MRGGEGGEKGRRHARLQRTPSIGQRSIRARLEFQFEPPRNVSDCEYREDTTEGRPKNSIERAVQ